MVDLRELDDKYKRLLGKLHEVMRKAEVNGVVIE